MRTIKELCNLYKVEGDVGVEIEVEGARLPYEVSFWKATGDGSLKGEENVEYVLRKPVTIPTLNSRLKTLKAAFLENKSRFDETYRAGVHVHVNVQELTAKQLFTYVTLYLTVEELLLTFCAKHRTGNHFCLRACDAGFFPDLIWRCIEQKNLRLLGTDDIRYSALNLKPVVSYGSVEFRSHESTFDFDKIHKWAAILVQLREASLKFNDPREVMEAVSVGGFDGFVRDSFGPYAEEFLGKPDWEKMIRRGILIAQDIAYSRNWNGVNLNIFSKEQDW